MGHCRIPLDANDLKYFTSLQIEKFQTLMETLSKRDDEVSSTVKKQQDSVPVSYEENVKSLDWDSVETGTDIDNL